MGFVKNAPQMFEWNSNAVANASAAMMIMENITCKHNLFSCVEIFFWKKQNNEKNSFRTAFTQQTLKMMSTNARTI